MPHTPSNAPAVFRAACGSRLRISYGEWRKEHSGRYHIFPPISFVQWIFCKGKHSICDHDDRGGGEFQRLHDRFIFLSQGAAAEERLVALIVLCVEASFVQTVSESEEDLRLFLKCLPSGAKTFGTGLPTDLIESTPTLATQVAKKGLMVEGLQQQVVSVASNRCEVVYGYFPGARVVSNANIY